MPPMESTRHGQEAEGLGGIVDKSLYFGFHRKEKAKQDKQV